MGNCTNFGINRPTGVSTYVEGGLLHTQSHSYCRYFHFPISQTNIFYFCKPCNYTFPCKMRGGNFLFASARHAVTAINQNTVPMVMRVQGISFVLHDNRIFAFSIPENTEPDQENGILPATESSSPEQTMILNILMTPGFRLLSFVYIVFRLLDNSTLIVIIISMILYGTFSMPSSTDVALLGTIGLEVFYDIMLNVNKYWSLQVLSLIIGLLLYIIYYSILLIKHDRQELNEDQYHFILYAITFRLVAFLFEETVDIAVDCCLHNTLLYIQSMANQHSNTTFQQTSSGNGNRSLSGSTGHPSLTAPLMTTPSPFQVGFGSHVSNNSQQMHTSTTSSILQGIVSEWEMLRINRVNMPTDIVYLGSFSAWGTYSVFSYNEENDDGTVIHNDFLEHDSFHLVWIVLMLLIPTLISVAIAICVGVLAVAAALSTFVIVGVLTTINIMVSRICRTLSGTNQNNVHHEACHETIVRHMRNYYRELWRV